MTCETISEYVVEIKKLTAGYDFGTILKEALRNRFIVGFKNDAIRCKLLSTEDGKDLSFDRAYTSALGMETVQGQSKKVWCTNEEAASTSVQADVNWQRKSVPRQVKKNFPASMT